MIVIKFMKIKLRKIVLLIIVIIAIIACMLLLELTVEKINRKINNDQNPISINTKQNTEDSNLFKNKSEIFGFMFPNTAELEEIDFTLNAQKTGLESIVEDKSYLPISFPNDLRYLAPSINITIYKYDQNILLSDFFLRNLYESNMYAIGSNHDKTFPTFIATDNEYKIIDVSDNEKFILVNSMCNGSCRQLIYKVGNYFILIGGYRIGIDDASINSEFQKILFNIKTKDFDSSKYIDNIKLFLNL